MSNEVELAIRKMREAQASAVKSRNLALAQREIILARVERSFTQSGRDDFGDLSLVKDWRVMDDKVYRMHMGDQQWFTQETIKYALVALAELKFFESVFG